GDQIYWANRGEVDATGITVPGTGTVRRLDPALAAPITVADSLDAPSAIAAASGILVWANAGRGALIDIDPADGKTELVATYEQDTGSLQRLDPGATAPQLIAGGQDAPVAVARDGDR